jgi:hypothetical protein
MLRVAPVAVDERKKWQFFTLSVFPMRFQDYTF